MEAYPWWEDEHKKLAVEVNRFVDDMLARDDEAWWCREFPWDIVKEIARKGYYGVGIAREYGGLGLGMTGTTIVTEALCRLSSGIGVFVADMLGGIHQISKFGTEEQKEKWLPRIVKGELGAVAITEPYAGTDTAEISTIARKKGENYILTGKKRYVTGTGVASHYMLYARTKDDIENIRKYRHLSAFIVEKGMKGFTVEKINELTGLDNVPNGYLNLDEVVVPRSNMIGEDGDGWRIMMSGFNYERVICAAVGVAGMYEALRNIVPYGQRRIQFGMPTIDMTNNQFKIAEILTKLKMGRLATYYSAYLVDLGQEAAVECSMSKLFCSDSFMEVALAASHFMGGDGVNRFYPVERLFRDARIHQIAGGTPEAMKMLIYRMSMRQMADELKKPRRKIHPDLNVPVASNEPVKKYSEINESAVLEVLAEDYRVNPGLYMTREDLKQHFEVDDRELDTILQSLENARLVKLYRKQLRIEMVKATYEGLKKVHPAEYYRWIPSWVKEENIF